jgi:chemotaxis protein CheD
MTGPAQLGTTIAARHIARGAYAVGGAGEGPISTILGSCVACCLFDPERRLGGINHFLLPDPTGSSLAPASFGTHAMELLINALLSRGAERARLRAKAFGGARVVDGLSDIGARNSVFVLEFLARERIPCLGESLGGTEARRIEFWPAEGRVRQRFLGDVRRAEIPVAPPSAPAGDIDLF